MLARHSFFLCAAALLAPLVTGCPGPSETPDAAMSSMPDSAGLVADASSPETDTGGPVADTGGPAADTGGMGACPADVSGVYDVVWTSTPTSCPTPDTAITIGASGLDPGSDIDCGALMCSAATCTVTPLASCQASVTVSGPCASLAAGRVITSSFQYGADGTATFTITDSMEATTGGSCSHTGVATRRAR